MYPDTPNMWVEPTGLFGGSNANNGLGFATPKLDPNALGTIPVNTHVGVISNTDPVAIGNVTFTTDSQTATLATHYPLLQYDILTLAGFAWPISVESYSNPTVSFTTGKPWRGPSGTFAVYMYRAPVLTAPTTAKLTFTGATPNYFTGDLIKVSFGWKSAIDRGGVAILNMGGVNASLTFSVECGFLQSPVVFQSAGTGINIGRVGVSLDKAVSIRNTGGVSPRMSLMETNGFYGECTGYGFLNFGSGVRSDGSVAVNNNYGFTTISSIKNAIVAGNAYSAIYANAEDQTIIVEKLTTGVIGTALIQFNYGRSMLLRSCDIVDAKIQQLNNPGGKVRCHDYNRIIGYHKTFISMIGSFELFAGDAQIALQSGVTSAVSVLLNLNAGRYVGPTPTPNVSSRGICTMLHEQPIALYLPAGSYTFRLPTCSELSLDATNYRLGISANGSVVTSTESITARASANDWQYVTAAVTLASAGIVNVDVLLRWYHASARVVIGPLEYSVDAGTTWIRCDQSWVDAEPVWSLPANGPAEGTVTTPTVYGRFRELSGSVNVAALNSSYENSRNDALDKRKLVDGYDVLNRGVLVEGEYVAAAQKFIPFMRGTN